MQSEIGYELPEEELLKILSYKNIKSLDLQGFDITQTFINELAKLSKLEEFSATYSNFEDTTLDYTPLKKLSDKLKNLYLYYNWIFFHENISKDHIKGISKFNKLTELHLVSWNGLKKDASFSPLKDLKKLNTVIVVLYGGKLKKNMISAFKSTTWRNRFIPN